MILLTQQQLNPNRALQCRRGQTVCKRTANYLCKCRCPNLYLQLLLTVLILKEQTSQTNQREMVKQQQQPASTSICILTHAHMATLNWIKPASRPSASMSLCIPRSNRRTVFMTNPDRGLDNCHSFYLSQGCTFVIKMGIYVPRSQTVSMSRQLYLFDLFHDIPALPMFQ